MSYSPNSLIRTYSSNHVSNYSSVRTLTDEICAPLSAEDAVLQAAEFASPAKWHLAHTSWFFETFILKKYLSGYKEFHPHFNFLFNSYYEAIGTRLIRSHRGNMSRPTLSEVMAYRKHVDEAMATLLSNEEALSHELIGLLDIGLHHEMQHQELIFTDIKYLFGRNPLFPVYSSHAPDLGVELPELDMLTVEEGRYLIGFAGSGFSFDNEHNRHEVLLPEYAIANRPVSWGEYAEFIAAGGYHLPQYWTSDGWEWVKQTQAKSPLYVHEIDGIWHRFTLGGLRSCDSREPAWHLNWYEASAYAAWKGMRLPTEQEWETAAKIFGDAFVWGRGWEWTGSAYLPYPGYKQPEGAIGEYNGKFMINQMVLRGASVVTTPGHSRPTYRNFFQPHHQWQFSTTRLAR